MSLLAIAAVLATQIVPSHPTKEELATVEADMEQVDLEQMGERVSRYAEGLIVMYGLSRDELTYCMTELNMQIDAHPDELDPDKVVVASGGYPEKIRVVEQYDKVFLRKCLGGLR